MADPRRILRLQQLILETAAQYLQREIKDPRIGLVSVTRVKLAKDLSRATIGWSCLGTETERRTCARGLKDATATVQREIADAMRTRVTPVVDFRYDPSLERAQALEEVFEAIRREKAAHGESPEDAPEPEAPEEG